ncbi:NRT1/ PTR family 1.2-like protein, partial [Tanacetum coccineum]
MSVVLGGNVLLMWYAATNSLPIVGAFLADPFLVASSPFFLALFSVSWFFNKACILTKPEDTIKDPWCNCKVEQVEELKALIRVIPLWIDTSLKTLKYQQRHWDSYGLGLVFSILAIEEKAIEEGFYNDSQAVVKMSAMWLVPQQVFHGLSEALNIIGQMEFYYSEFPKSMSSVATSLYLLGA